MKAKERGLVKPDAPINQYLSKDIAEQLSESDRIAVRMLFNHSSGYVNFTTRAFPQRIQPAVQPARPDGATGVCVRQTPVVRTWHRLFYSNTNYLLLQFILEHVTGKTWGDMLHADILQPLGLSQSLYPVTDDQVRKLGFPNYYFERFENGELENCSKWHNEIAHSLHGYGGIAANGADVIRFYEALMNDQVVSQASLDEMRQWITGKESTEPDYGLGHGVFRVHRRRAHLWSRGRRHRRHHPDFVYPVEADLRVHQHQRGPAVVRAVFV